MLGRGKPLLDWPRTVWVRGPMLFLRRAAAVLLVLAAALLAVQPREGPAAAEVPVLVAAHDLGPGRTLTGADVVVRSMPTDLAPAGALKSPAPATGRVLATAARRGEPLTDARFVGAELTRLTTGDSAHAAVVITLAEPGIAQLLYPGRRVDIVTAAERSSDVSVLAERVPVIAIHALEGDRDQGGLVVVGLPEEQAAAVAAASMTHSLTVTLR